MVPPQAPQEDPNGDDVPWPRSGNYRCDVCGKYLSRRDALVRHTRLIHGAGKKHFWCREPQCVRVKKGFRRFYDYRKHMTLHHNVVAGAISQPSNNVAGANQGRPRVRAVANEPQFMQPYGFVPQSQYQVQPWGPYDPRMIPQPMAWPTPWQTPYTTPSPTPYAMPWQMPLQAPAYHPYHPYQQAVVPGYMPDLAHTAPIAAGNAANFNWGHFTQFPGAAMPGPLYQQPQFEPYRAAAILPPQEPTQLPGGRVESASADGQQGLLEECLKQENASQ
ncbi:hypothetical protein F4678DRAFT_481446 [Xylaria arbuscula]|nr:hypothetical protein F4678DRAFT_481446 [Xylaria arbuscula]